MGHKDAFEDWEAQFARERAIKWAASFAARSFITLAAIIGLCALTPAPITPTLAAFYALFAIVGVLLWDADSRAFERWDLDYSGGGKAVVLMLWSLIVSLVIWASAWFA